MITPVCYVYYYDAVKAKDSLPLYFPLTNKNLSYFDPIYVENGILKVKSCNDISQQKLGNVESW